MRNVKLVDVRVKEMVVDDRQNFIRMYKADAEDLSRWFMASGPTELILSPKVEEYFLRKVGTNYGDVRSEQFIAVREDDRKIMTELMQIFNDDVTRYIERVHIEAQGWINGVARDATEREHRRIKRLPRWKRLLGRF